MVKNGCLRLKSCILHLLLNYQIVIQRQPQIDFCFILETEGLIKNYRENLDELIEKTSGVRFVGNIADSELVSFFRTSDALFFLSRYEGFGLPILEAAQQGCRVITSNVSAMPEVAPPGSLIVDLETSDEQIAEEIASYLDSKINSNSGFLKQFSWGNTVKHIFGD